MSNDRDRMIVEGVVEDSNKGTFIVNVPNTNGADHKITCKLAGKIRQFSVKILVGDKVRVEVSPYEMNKGRIVFRMK